MTSGETSQNSQRSERATETAARYKQEFVWADEIAMEVSLLVFGTAAEQSTAISRMFSAMGQSRTRGRYTALRVLFFAEGRRLTQNEIRAAMHVTSPNVTYLIDELEKEGLVRRSPNPNDRRATIVELTEDGEKVAGLLAPAMARFMSGMSRGFSDEEKEIFRDLLLRFMTNTTSDLEAGGVSAE